MAQSYGKYQTSQSIKIWNKVSKMKTMKDATQTQLESSEIINDERGDAPGLWWLSFCDTKNPSGYQFLGVAIVEAPGFISALKKTWTLRINPGGEVKGWPVEGVPPEYRDRLLSREEVEDAGLC